MLKESIFLLSVKLLAHGLDIMILIRMESWILL